MTILFNNLKRIFGKPVNIIIMLVVPIVLNIFFIKVSNSASKYKIGVVDNDKSKLTKSFIDELEDNADITDYESDETIIKNAIINSEVDLIIEFDENYEKDILSGKNVNVKIYSIKETNDSEPMKLLVSSFTSTVQEIAKASDGDAEKFYAAVEKYYEGSFESEYEEFEFSPEENVKRAISSLGYLAMGMMFLMSFSTTLILQDKQTYIYDKLMTTPTSRASYYIQHFLSYFIVALIQTIAIINIVPKVADITFGSTDKIKTGVIIVTMLFALCCISIGIIISRFSKDMKTAGAFISVINLPVLMLGGCLWPRDIMPSAIQKIGDFVPPTWFMKAAETVMYDGNLNDAILPIVELTGLSVVLLVISFTVKTDK